MSNTLRMTARDFEERISYPPRRKKAPPLPPVKSAESHSILEQYHDTVREKRKREAREAPLLNFTLQGSASADGGGKTALRLVQDGQRLFASGATSLEGGDAVEGRKLLDDAAAVLKEAIRLGVNTTDVHCLLADVYRSREMYQEAVGSYSRALALVGDSFLQGDWVGVRLYKSRAECYSEMGLEAAPHAAAEYDAYMQMEEPTFDTLLAAGKAHLDSSNLRRAGELFEYALTMQESSPLLHFYLGELREREGEIKRARKHFARAVEVDPDFATPYREEAERLFACGDAPSLWGALGLYQSMLKLHPDHALFYIRLADIYDRLGPDYVARSIAMLDAALKLELPSNVSEDSLVRRGILKLDAYGDLEGALSDFSQCLLINSSHPLGLERRAAVLLQRGDAGDMRAAAADYEVLVSLPSDGSPGSVETHRKAEPYFFLAEWYFDRRFDGPDSHEDSSGSTDHYIATLRKSVSAFHNCRTYGVGPERFSRATAANRERIEKVMLGTAAVNGYLLRAASVLSREDRPISSKGADKGGLQLSEGEAEEALQCEPLCLRIMMEYYQWNRSLEPTCHSELFHEFQDGPAGLQLLGFKAYTEDMERRRAAAEVLKGGKKGKKK
eukprot:Hpha_TRINITY_DN18620_c0_g1::TRINITY_DN18620_c0_g1_i1::g.115768::m.115768